MFQQAVPSQDLTNPVSLSSVLFLERFSLPWLYVIPHFSYDRSNWSSPSFNNTTHQNL